MALFSMWLMPDASHPLYEQIQKLVTDLSQRFGGPVFAPHVTLLSFSAADEEEAKAKVQSFASKITSFEVILGSRDDCIKLDAWNQDVILCAKETESLKSTHIAARQDMGLDAEVLWAPPSHRPHLSLMYGLHDEEEGQKIIQYVHSIAGEWLFEAKWEVTNLAFWRIPSPTLEGVPGWTQVATIPIAKAVDASSSCGLRTSDGLEQVCAAFKAWDLNGDGSISFDELKVVLQELDSAIWTADRLDSLSQTVANKFKGALQWEDFLTWLFTDGKMQQCLRGAVDLPCGEKTILLRIALLSGDMIDMYEESTAIVAKIKAEIEKACGIPTCEQELLFGETKMADDVGVGSYAPVSNSRPDSCAKALNLTLVRRRVEVLLCEVALKNCHAKNLSTEPILVSASGNRGQTIAPGESWAYGRIEDWDCKYYDLDFTNGGGLSRTGHFSIKASNSMCSQEWKLEFSPDHISYNIEIRESPPEVAHLARK